jgi:3-methylfumaryl-CoA hydratase
MTDLDIDHLKGWIGRQQQTDDVIAPRLVRSYNAIFDADLDVKTGEEAPAGIHWCLAPDIAPMKELGPDGHPARGGFLPPVPFPRRMWAGGRLAFAGKFRIGDEVSKRSVIDDVVLKTGRSGALVFVTVRHEYSTSRGVILQECQDIVYREQEARSPGTAAAGPASEPLRSAERSQPIDATPTLLFRYSAITFNGHRIHYDQAYVTGEEGYPGLIFHGPLQASYLLRLAVDCGGGVLPGEFSFRSTRPLFAGGQVTINAAKAEAETALWVADQSGRMTMTATARGA